MGKVNEKGEETVFVTLRAPVQAMDAKTTKKERQEGDPYALVVVMIPEGRHEVERIENPFEHEAPPWLVLKGTETGAAEEYWRAWEDPRFFGILFMDPRWAYSLDLEKIRIIIEE